MSEILQRFHDAMRHKSADELADLYAEDGVHEFPFGGVPAYEGREAVRAGYMASWGASPAEVKDVELVELHHTTDPSVVVARHRTVVTVNGKEFTIPGLLIIQTRDGRITRTQDFMDATAIAAMRSAAA